MPFVQLSLTPSREYGVTAAIVAKAHLLPRDRLRPQFDDKLVRGYVQATSIASVAAHSVVLLYEPVDFYSQQRRPSGGPSAEEGLPNSEVAMTMFILSIIEDVRYSTPLDELVAYDDGTTPAYALLRRKIEAEAATAIEAARDGSSGKAGPDREQEE